MNEELKVMPPDYAFPQPYQECMSHLKGLTMRDYFAAKAIAALIVANGPNPLGGWPTFAERTAYLIADAMLEARK